MPPTVLGLMLIIAAGLIIALILLRTPDEVGLGELQVEALPDSSLSEQERFLEHLNQGNTALSQYEFDKALYHFNEALKIRNGDASVHFKIGRVLFQKEDYPAAIQAFHNTLNLNSRMVEAYYELARIYQLLNNLEQAHQELDSALDIKPEHEDVLKLKVRLYEQEKNYQQALTPLAALIEISTTPIKYRVMRAEFLILLSRFEEAIAEYTELMDQDPISTPYYNGKIGQVYYEMQDYVNAIEYFKLLLQDQRSQKDPEFVNDIKNQMAAALCNEGVRYFDRDQYNAAIRQYKEALVYDDRNADIHYNMGKALARTSEPQKATEHFQKAIQINPRDVGSFYEMALMQDERGMVSEAIFNYEKVLELEPENSSAAFGLGTLYGVQGNIDKAIQVLSSAVRLNPQFVDAIYNLGVALEQKKEFGKAAKMYKKVLLLEPSHEKARSNLIHIQHLRH